MSNNYKIEEYSEEPLLPHLAVCVTFFYLPERLAYLAKVISNYIGIASKTDIYIVTNIGDTKPIAEALPHLPDHMSVEFVTPSGIGHPYLLTWTHRDIFQTRVLPSSEVSHFLYSEDDLLFSRSNVMYWLRYREPLQKHGLIPSFFRVEQHRQKGWVSSDCKSPIQPDHLPRLILEDGTLFIGMQIPYQAMYFLDRQLMEEFASSPAMSPDFGKWNIREKAAQGLTFVNIPQGYTSRNVVPFDPNTKTISQESWIHHLPNNYANNPYTLNGKLPMREHNSFAVIYELRLRKNLLKFMHFVKRKLIDIGLIKRNAFRLSRLP